MNKRPRSKTVDTQDPRGDQATPPRSFASDIAPEADVTHEKTETASTAAVLEEPTGRHWLKYAGIGAARSRKGTGDQAASEEITSLGSLEAEILGILWEIGGPATGMDVMEAALYKRRAQGQEPPAFATVATTLRRMASKGILESRKNDARSPTYWPTVGREQMAARILNNVSQTLLGFSLHALLPKLIGRPPSQATSPDEEENIQRLMKALERVAEADQTSGVRTSGVQADENAEQSE